MKILVTGGSGFLGKHLCRALVAAGHTVTNIDKKPCALQEVQTIVGDVMDDSLVEQTMPGHDAVFHLASYIEAGESVEQPRKYLENNILGTLVVLESMRKHGIKKFLFSSSAAIYGEPLRTPIQENDRTLPINPYGMTKLAMEGLVSSYAYAFGFTGVALRYFNLYGPEEDHEPETHAIPRFARQIMHGDEVTVWGDGSNKRDYVYVEDVVRAHLLALPLPQGYHYMNLSGKNATSVLEIIHILEKLIGKPAKITHFDARPGDPMELFADATKAKNILGWEPQVELEEGLQKTVQWIMKA